MDPDKNISDSLDHIQYEFNSCVKKLFNDYAYLIKMSSTYKQIWNIHC